MKMNKKGFTIVELVIVIAVIAILAAVLIPTFSGLVEKAQESATIQEARNRYTEYVGLHDYVKDGAIKQNLFIEVDKGNNNIDYVVVTNGALVAKAYDELGDARAAVTNAAEYFIYCAEHDWAAQTVVVDSVTVEAAPKCETCQTTCKETEASIGDATSCPTCTVDKTAHPAN